MSAGPPAPEGTPRNDAGLTAAELRGWHERLKALANELAVAETAAGGTGDAVELDQSKVGRLSRMDALQMQAMAQAEAQRRRAHAQRVQAALIRVDNGLNGDYGLCRECELPIDPKRLAVDPAAILCFACANAR